MERRSEALFFEFPAVILYHGVLHGVHETMTDDGERLVMPKDWKPSRYISFAGFRRQPEKCWMWVYDLHERRADDSILATASNRLRALDWLRQDPLN